MPQLEGSGGKPARHEPISHSTNLSHLLSPCWSGVATSFPLYPLETARTRLAIDGDKYLNLYGTLSTVVRQEGFGALYRVRDAVHG